MAFLLFVLLVRSKKKTALFTNFLNVSNALVKLSLDKLCTKTYNFLIYRTYFDINFSSSHTTPFESQEFYHLNVYPILKVDYNKQQKHHQTNLFATLHHPLLLLHTDHMPE